MQNNRYLQSIRSSRAVNPTPVHPYLLQIVEAYMGGPTSRTDLQLLVSQPGSAHQFFHQDNSQRALTVVRRSNALANGG